MFHAVYFTTSCIFFLDCFSEVILITSYDPRPMLERHVEQMNMFEPEAERGRLVLVHEPHSPICVAMPEGK